VNGGIILNRLMEKGNARGKWGEQTKIQRRLLRRDPLYLKGNPFKDLFFCV